MWWLSDAQCPRGLNHFRKIQLTFKTQTQTGRNKQHCDPEKIPKISLFRKKITKFSHLSQTCCKYDWCPDGCWWTCGLLASSKLNGTILVVLLQGFAQVNKFTAKPECFDITETWKFPGSILLKQRIHTKILKGFHMQKTLSHMPEEHGNYSSFLKIAGTQTGKIWNNLV